MSQTDGSAYDDEALGGMRRSYETMLPTFRAMADAYRALIIQLCNSSQYEVESVTARAKDPSSVAEKIRRRNYATLDLMVDKCGVRVVTKYQSNVEPICNLLHREFDVIEDAEHGAETPQLFGYASRHLVVRLEERRSSLLEWRQFDGLVAEIQVRSILQHAWASISHSLTYKSEEEVPARARRRLYRMAALLETGDEVFDSFRDEVEQLRAEYRSDAVSDAWEQLPLNADSLEAAWGRIDWWSVARAAQRAGWTGTTLWTYSLPLDETERTAVADLISTTSVAGLKTVGELAEHARRASDSALLKRILDQVIEIDPDGKTPAAVSYYVIQASIVAALPEIFRAAAEEAAGGLAPRLRRAAINVGLASRNG